jgi:Ni,Fe-hydrogenase I small subunit
LQGDAGAFQQGCEEKKMVRILQTAAIAAAVLALGACADLTAYP